MSQDSVLTLVASDIPLTESLIGAVEIVLHEQNIKVTKDHRWLSPQRAIDIHLPYEPDAAGISAIRSVLDAVRVDMFINPVEGRKKKLLIADMDSTIVQGETLDDIAAEFGIGEKVASITARTMNGDLDFQSSLKERVLLLSGRSAEALEKVRSRTKFNFGADILTETMRRHMATSVLVSGGFTYFTSYVAEKAYFDYHHGNNMQIRNGKITGVLTDSILDSRAKLSFMNEYMSKLRIKPDQVMAIGDGANDKDIIEAAGLGIGFYPKPILEEVTHNIIRYGDLTAALFAQGYLEKEFRVRRPQR